MAAVGHRPRFGVLTACLIGCLLAGCTVVGPSAIRSGRLAYNDAITETNNQQILKIIIQDRYEEKGHLLSVASVTANVRVTSSAGIQAGFGDGDNYDGNLVPFSGGFIYEENPTISYTPVAGETYLRQVMSPLPLSLLVRITGNLSLARSSYDMLVSSVNGIYNPDFLYDKEENDPRFDRFTEIMAELTAAHRLNWVQDPQRQGKFSLAIDQSLPAHAEMVGELLELTGIQAEGQQSNVAIIPVSLAWNGGNDGEMCITTRSVWDLVEILAGAIDVPEEDLENGIARRALQPGAAGRKLRVHHSDSKPDNAYVAVPFRDGWYYIDERDLVTKRYFKLMGSLWTTTMADATARTSAAPVLTIPVSR
jgi:hypothetical protein